MLPSAAHVPSFMPTRIPAAIIAPPPYASLLASDDVDEVTSWVARRDGFHSRVVHGAGPYGFRLALIEGRRVHLGWARTGLAYTVRATSLRPTFHLPLTGRQHYAFGRRRHETAAGMLTFMPPGAEAARRSDGSRLLAVEFETSALAAAARARSGGMQADWPPIPQAIDLSDRTRLGLFRAIADLSRTLEPQVPQDLHEHAEQQLISLLAGIVVSNPAANQPAPVADRRIADLEEWVEAHLAECISLARLCEVVGTGERSLQLAFRKRRGMSPMRFVAERRLAVAHQRLCRAGTDEDVTAIATSLGFTHLGRFAVAYRSTFGESPSQTLLRARGGQLRGDRAAATPRGTNA